uniref:Secreted protein n=1 Tax=Haemonchus contortus TaxID=6289 RepID=A0A7I5EC56_HAECO
VIRPSASCCVVSVAVLLLVLSSAVSGGPFLFRKQELCCTIVAKRYLIMSTLISIGNLEETLASESYSVKML